MDSTETPPTQKYPCFHLDDPVTFRTCLCERGISAYCDESANTTSEDTFWTWGQNNYSDKHAQTVKNVVVQRRDYENNSTQSWGLFMILMGIFPIGVLFVCFFACNYRRRWMSRSSLSSRPWPSGSILEPGRATPGSLASAELEPLVSTPPAQLVSPDLAVESSSLGQERLERRVERLPLGQERPRAGGGPAAARRARSEGHLDVVRPVSRPSSPVGVSGPPPSYSQTLLESEPPSYEAVFGEGGETEAEGAV
ncbi:uncharacterized protein LOC122384750 [Amphibalanus amphitrite]|uniref:uncharacterized protein LOC122384750 n=1 Tax=Amphibalanus amphitrite TaxID=1232801 RepID=UPI001C905CAB|nr:uncharacterized protein LOC122384750 [Amphibalanus amphitrite]